MLDCYKENTFFGYNIPLVAIQNNDKLQITTKDITKSLLCEYSPYMLNEFPRDDKTLGIRATEYYLNYEVVYKTIEDKTHMTLPQRQKDLLLTIMKEMLETRQYEIDIVRFTLYFMNRFPTLDTNKKYKIKIFKDYLELFDLEIWHISIWDFYLFEYKFLFISKPVKDFMKKKLIKEIKKFPSGSKNRRNISYLYYVLNDKVYEDREFGLYYLISYFTHVPLLDVSVTKRTLLTSFTTSIPSVSELIDMLKEKIVNV